MNVSGVFEELIDHGFEDIDQARGLEVINAALSDVAARELWPQLLKTAALEFDSGDTEPNNWPTDVGTIQTVWVPGRGEIPFRRVDDVHSTAALMADYPTAHIWTLDGTTLHVFGAPDQTVYVDYFSIPEPVDETATEADIWLPPAFHRDILINGCVFRLYLKDDDVELSREFERLYEKGIENARLRLHVKHLSDDYIHVVNPDDWHDDS